MDKLARSSSGSEAEETTIKNAGQKVHEFVKRRWKENRWEPAWFIDPPVRCFIRRADCSSSVSTHSEPVIQRLQSIPGLVHIHVLGSGDRKKKRPPGVLDYRYALSMCGVTIHLEMEEKDEHLDFQILRAAHFVESPSGQSPCPRYAFSKLLKVP